MKPRKPGDHEKKRSDFQDKKSPYFADFEKSKLNWCDHALKIVDTVSAEKEMPAKRVIKLLKNKLINELVYTRAKKNFTTENLEFLLAYDDFVKEPSKEKLQTILNQFIPHTSSPFDSSTEINIDTKVRKRCQDALATYEEKEATKALAEAANELASTLTADATTLLRYQKSTKDFPELRAEILKLKKKNESTAVPSDVKPPRV